MGRPKRIRESTGIEYQSDRDLVEQFQLNMDKAAAARKETTRKLYSSRMLDAAYEMWEKYFKLRMKMRAEMAALCRRNSLHYPELYEEYDAEAWEKFILQFQGIRLEDVAHLPNWSIYIRLWGYWRSMNRDLLKKWFDWNINTIPIYSLTRNDGKDSSNESLTNIDVEIAKRGDQINSQLEIEMNREIFWEALDNLKTELTPKQKKLINMKASGYKNREIISTLKINGKIFRESLNFIKQRLETKIIAAAKRRNTNLTYSEMLSSFGG